MKTIKTAIVLSTAALLLSALQYFQPNRQKVAYVLVEEVISEYHAMQDVNDRLALNESTERGKLDEFYRTIQGKVAWLRDNHKSISDNEIVEKQHEIIDLEGVYGRMEQETHKRLDSLRVSWTTPIYEDVNQFIKDYSMDNGYDYVLGNLGNGNLMYGNPVYNITLEIIDAINVNYNRDNLE